MALILIVLLFAGIGFTLWTRRHCTENCNCPCRYILLTIDMLGKLRRILLDCQLCSLTLWKPLPYRRVWICRRLS
ncbi:MAG: hypothetical protein ABR985_01930 [Methanotrichaceae archaeon]